MRNSDRACETLIFRYGLYETFIGVFTEKVKKDDPACEYLIILARWCEFISERGILFENLISMPKTGRFRGLDWRAQLKRQVNGSSIENDQ
jgi:hypothetical protein